MKYGPINVGKVTTMFETLQKYILAEFPWTDCEISEIDCSYHRDMFLFSKTYCLRFLTNELILNLIHF